MVQILLATYNGEKYLPEQLASLDAQTYRDWKLLVRDDNSTDKTPTILQEFADSHRGKVQIIRDRAEGPNERLGPKNNFGRLMKLSNGAYKTFCDHNAPYVMFCDQDDIWHPDKIAKSIKKMKWLEKEYHEDIPLLVHSDVAVINDAGKKMAASLNDAKNKRKEYTPLSRMLVNGYVQGMTMMANRPLIEKSFPLPECASMHDGWVSKVAAAIGYIGYLSQPTIDYRQHDANVISAHMGKSTKTRNSKSVQDYVTRKHDQILAEFKLKGEDAKVLLKRYGKEMKPDRCNVLRQFIALPEQSPEQRRLTIARYGFFPRDNLKRTLKTVLFC